MILLEQDGARDQPAPRLAQEPAVRSVHVIPGLEIAYGGPSYSVPRLCRALAANGAETSLYSVAERGTRPSDIARDGYQDRRFPWDFIRVPVVRGVRGSGALENALYKAAQEGAVLHSHGLWLLPNVYVGWAAHRSRTGLLISPRGMLSTVALSFSQLKKRAFWRLLQEPVVRGAACIHATSIGEYEEVRAFGLTNPVAIIPNGVDVPELSPLKENETARAKTVLSLGRIHPKKGLDRLIAAWARIETSHPAWRLRIVGPSEGGHASQLSEMAARLGLKHVSIEEPVYGPEKETLYRSADIFVLPTSNENFAMTVAEALAAGVPVISTKGAPWSGLESEGCGWWIDIGIDPMAQALDHAMTMPSEHLTAMGAKGRAWMLRDFSWERVARDLLEVYRWIDRRDPPPQTVRFS